MIRFFFFPSRISYIMNFGAWVEMKYLGILGSTVVSNIHVYMSEFSNLAKVPIRH